MAKHNDNAKILDRRSLSKQEKLLVTLVVLQIIQIAVLSYPYYSFLFHK